MKKTFTYSAIASAVLFSINFAYAEEQTQQLETIEVVGSVAKDGRISYLSPRSITVLTSEQIKEQGSTQLDQALRYEAGVTAQLYGADLDDSDWLKVRGFDARLTLDGSAIYKGGYSGWNPDLYGFEAVEVVKGADSLTYGSAVAGGIVNLVSKRPTAEPQGEINLKTGNRQQRGVSFDVSNKLADSVGFRLVGDYDKKNGQTTGTWLERYYFAPSVTWAISDRTSFTLLASAQKDVGVPTTSFYPLKGTLDTTEGTISNRANLGDPTTDTMDRKAFSLGYELRHDFGNDLIFSQNYRYNQDDRNQFAAYYSAVAEFPIINRGALAVDVITHNHTIDNRIAKTWKMDNLENTLIAGVDYQYMSAKGEYGYSFAAGSVNALAPIYSGVARFAVPTYLAKQRQLGLYLQDKVKVNNWQFSAGVRYDKAKGNSDSAPFGIRTQEHYNIGNTSYSAAVMYMADNGLTPYYSYAESFQPIAGADGTGIAYKPIKGQQHEIGLKYTPDFIDGKLSLAYFDLTERNGLVQTGGITTQVAKNSSKGLEVSADINITENLSAALSYTYLKAKETGAYTGVVIRKPLVARHNVAARIVYQLDKLTVGTAVRYVGTSNDEAGNVGIKVPAVTLVDLMAKYQFNDHWALQTNITNLTNKRYVSGCYYSCYYGEERKVDATLSYKW